LADSLPGHKPWICKFPHATTPPLDHTLLAKPQRRCTIAEQAPAADQSQRRDATRRFAIEAARLAASTRCHSVVILDVSALSPVTDFFVLATGTSDRQMRSVAEEIAEFGEGQDFKALSISGLEGGSWILVDFFDVVLHVFNNDSRQFYDLDSLWGDAPRVEWEANPNVANPT
jgi:ribosome-associated protein